MGCRKIFVFSFLFLFVFVFVVQCSVVQCSEALQRCGVEVEIISVFCVFLYLLIFVFVDFCIC